ncbi:DNA polymerase beta domain protein region [Ammonifex degensii KC4]|uniref:DNA polymerase beta domain protein region n=1 Tax=Ammonifex degensii (strain DSM 10501 / KC4) TaxID=429009 RepID=C9RBM5_AMMDK|nr:nucleotidyltransferase domain-containing protein [Ammonifex degensii]ACX51652.1 DNA polymerase beta domain protein region [Ammonifex degensii KC4]
MDIVQVRRFLLEREKRRRQVREQACRQLIVQLKQILEEVLPSFPVERAYLYGSVLTGRWHPESDLDLAVEGRLSAEEFFRLWAELDRRLEPEVDLRELEKLPFREKVRREGMVVYERKGSPSSR